VFYKEGWLLRSPSSILCTIF